MVLPEKMTCISVDKNGTWLAGGTASGRIYLWEVRLSFHTFVTRDAENMLGCIWDPLQCVGCTLSQSHCPSIQCRRCMYILWQ